jgi:hypothetical protein
MRVRRQIRNSIVWMLSTVLVIVSWGMDELGGRSQGACQGGEWNDKRPNHRGDQAAVSRSPCKDGRGKFVGRRVSQDGVGKTRS